MSEAAALNRSPLVSGQRAKMREALMDAQLPIDDLEAEDLSLFAFDLGGEIIGYGGFEAYGENALIRSIVVVPAYRSRGLGRRILEDVVAQARLQGATRPYLLTNDARDYFACLGFTVVERSRAPASILSTRQAAGLCPATATLMARAS